MSPRFAAIDGRLVQEDMATIPVLDRGLLLGDGIFETIRIHDGQPEFFDDHFDRFCRSARALHIRQPWTSKDLLALCLEVVDKSNLSDASVRMTLTRGAYRGTLSDTGDPPRLIVTCSDVEHMDPALYIRGVSVSVCSIPRVHALDPSIKATHYLPAILARLEADSLGCYESLLADPSGRILECSTASFFAVRQGQVLTPPLRLGILAGITRNTLLRLARQAKIPAKERILRLRDISTFEEAFLTSAIRGILPIVTLGGQRLGDGRPGPITRRLMESFALETGRKFLPFPNL